MEVVLPGDCRQGCRHEVYRLANARVIHVVEVRELPCPPATATTGNGVLLVPFELELLAATTQRNTVPTCTLVHRHRVRRQVLDPLLDRRSRNGDGRNAERLDDPLTRLRLPAARQVCRTARSHPLHRRYRLAHHFRY